MKTWKSLLQPRNHLFWMVGDEVYLKKYFLQLVDEHFYPGKNQDQKITIFYADSLNLTSFLNTIFDMPLFGGTSVSVLQGIEKLKKADSVAIKNILIKSPSDTVLVFESEKMTTDEFGKWLKKDAILIDCKKLIDKRTSSWALEYAQQKFSRILRQDDAFLLVTLCGNHLSSVVSELEKIDLYLPNKTPITPDVILKVCGGNRTYTVFDLINSILDRKLYLSLMILNYLLEEGVAGLLISSLLNRCIANSITLFESRHTQSSETREESESNIPGFLISRYLRFISAYHSISQLFHLYLSCVELDMSLKSSKPDKGKQVLEKIIIRFILREE